MRKTKNKVGDVYPKESCIKYITSTQPWTSKQELQDAAEVLGLGMVGDASSVIATKMLKKACGR